MLAATSFFAPLSWTIAPFLLDLRRRLAWDGFELGEYFHATTDKQAVRDEVFAAIAKHPFTIQATIMEKSKAQSQVRTSKPRFYQTGYFFHFKHGVSKQLTDDHEALVTTASLGNRKERAAFQAAVGDVMRQTNKHRKWMADFMPCHADPCLQVADYGAWAIQRKWESELKDQRSWERSAVGEIRDLGYPFREVPEGPYHQATTARII
jgi:hypothetical protein